MMRSRDPGVLFAKGSILDVHENHTQKALDEIRNLSANQVVEASDERLVEHFVEKFDIAPLVLYPDRAETQVEETTVDPPGLQASGPRVSMAPPALRRQANP